MLRLLVLPRIDLPSATPVSANYAIFTGVISGSVNGHRGVDAVGAAVNEVGASAVTVSPFCITLLP